MRLTIIPSDKTVGVDGVFFSNLDLTTCAIPPNVHAFQWYETEGEVEFVDNSNRTKPQNELVSELPAWANACIPIWSVKKAEYDAAMEAKRLALEALEQAADNQPATQGTQTI